MGYIGRGPGVWRGFIARRSGGTRCACHAVQTDAAIWHRLLSPLDLVRWRCCDILGGGNFFIVKTNAQLPAFLGCRLLWMRRMSYSTRWDRRRRSLLAFDDPRPNNPPLRLIGPGGLLLLWRLLLLLLLLARVGTSSLITTTIIPAGIRGIDCCNIFGIHPSVGVAAFLCQLISILLTCTLLAIGGPSIIFCHYSCESIGNLLVIGSTLLAFFGTLVTAGHGSRARIFIGTGTGTCPTLANLAPPSPGTGPGRVGVDGGRFYCLLLLLLSSGSGSTTANILTAGAILGSLCRYERPIMCCWFIVICSLHVGKGMHTSTWPLSLSYSSNSILLEVVGRHAYVSPKMRTVPVRELGSQFAN